MAPIEKKYRPATDGSRPANVSADQFKQDPTVGKLQIECFNDVYKYYDAEIVQERGRGDRYANLLYAFKNAAERGGRID